ncbi:zinc finger BED domain-containing protein DAYSLEEPER-like [Denticeps clupeoides]|uniref:Transposase n=1 Tax=Denticeps clupeoides TaxID=299321 RepID=A0AAY4B834_9TELE|nr:zinc finger BED domain-containing protein DAYSLEEPER-like [Denticeps clupeoides]XP_028828056.1 zinc finger BED domain-containing protein DAYSLEEPER-like [Denticeps clupeoides]
MVGRKRRRDLWKHFLYRQVERKTECVVRTNGEKCGYKISGKNTTNLKRHLKAFHHDIEIPETAVPCKKTDKPTTAQDLFATRRYSDSSSEQHAKEKGIAQWVGRTGLPARMVEDEEFITMMAMMDKKFKVPTKLEILNLIEKMYNEEKEKVKQNLATARRITTGLDIWTTKGHAASFLAVSACYFNPEESKAEHKLLNLKEMVHPHAAESISALVEESMQEWGIPRGKVLTTITGNGSNAVASFRTYAGVATTSEEESEVEEHDNANDDDEHREGGGDRYDFGAIERTPCVAHTVQLVVNMVQKEPSIRRLLDKVRRLVDKFRKSPVATERLRQKCALVLAKDCPTRWSSLFAMISRCLEVKEHLAAVAEFMGWDDLRPSEWQEIGMLRELLLPFAEHTKSLESDTQSLSLVVPALLDLKNHLSEFSLAHGRTYKDAATLAQKMLSSMDSRFSVFLDIAADNFSPLPAAACFVDPCVAETLLENDDDEVQKLVRRAEDYIAHLVPREEHLTDDEQVANEGTEEPATTPAKRRRFKLFSSNRPSRPKAAKTINIMQEILKYKEGLSECHQTAATSAEDYWLTQCSSTVFPTLKPLALDLLAMPASQTFTERGFSLTGCPTCGHRNRPMTILERSAFLKVNKPKW